MAEIFCILEFLAAEGSRMKDQELGRSDTLGLLRLAQTARADLDAEAFRRRLHDDIGNILRLPVDEQNLWHLLCPFLLEKML